MAQDLATTIRLVCEMPHDAGARKLAQGKDMTIITVAWEDNGRSKNSSWGPCITDMTLEVEGHAMPLIKAPNFSDKTWDAPMEKIRLLVGNEHGEALRSTTLTEYLENFRDYLHDGTTWPKKGHEQRSLLAREKDSHVLMSAQACFLPVPELGGEVAFNVAAYQYQSHAQSPAVLAIISGVHGTSAHVITNKLDGGRRTRYQRLWFNKDGQACPFVGQLLKEWRVKRGQTTNLDAPLTEEEKLHNALLFIQVPLVQASTARSSSFNFGGIPKGAQMMPKSSGSGFSFGGVVPEGAMMSSPFGGFSFGGGAANPELSAQMMPKSSGSGFSFGGGGGDWEIADSAAVDFPEDEEDTPEGAFMSNPALAKYNGKTDAEIDEMLLEGEEEESYRGSESAKVTKKASTTKDAIVSIGDARGEYKELEDVGAKLKRDPRYPVRVTVQFYKTTSNGGVSDEDLAIIASQFDEVRTKTQGTPKAATSLVTAGDTGRPTEPGKVGWPAWWMHYYGTAAQQARARLGPPFPSTTSVYTTSTYTVQAFFNTLGDDYQSVGARLFKGGRFQSGNDGADIKALERYISLQQEAVPAGAARWGVF